MQHEGEVMEFQSMVYHWMQACFGPDDTASVQQRGWRFTEEAIELAQATGVTEDDVIKLVRRCYSRPVGEPTQEVGGVLVTLSGLCTALDIDMQHAGWQEVTRCWTMLPQIQAKNAAKKLDICMPGVVPEPTPDPATATCAHGVVGCGSASVALCCKCLDDERRRRRGLELAAWDLYLDANDNNPHRAISWDFLSQAARDTYIAKAQTHTAV